jgi:flagellar FliL protein
VKTLLKKEVAALLVMTGMLASVLYFGGRSDGQWRLWSLGSKPVPAEGAGEEAGAAIVKLEPIATRLSSPDDGDHYLSVDLDIEVAQQRDKDAVAGRLTQMRDATLSFLADRSTDDLRSSGALQSFKQQLLQRLEAAVPGRRLKAIYITNLVMQ